jgi:hypothetical protein
MLYDTYCAVDSKKIPITTKILKHMGIIENGFYIETGAFDGIFSIKY